MNRRKLKKLVIDTLGQKELGAIHKTLAGFDAGALVNPLFSSLCHTNERVRWHSISILGKVVKVIADRNIEDARVIMRRFLWMLNDESGGIGWGVPEAMAEAMINKDMLADEYLHMLVSYTLDDGPELYQQGNFLEMPLLQRGVLWGLCRVSLKYRPLLLHHKIEENLGPYLCSADSQVIGLACCLVELLGLTEYFDKMHRFCNANEVVRIYLEGSFFDLSLAKIVKGIVDHNGHSNNPFLNITEKKRVQE